MIRMRNQPRVAASLITLCLSLGLGVSAGTTPQQKDGAMTKQAKGTFDVTLKPQRR